jgi:hypothetical protein
MRTSKSVLFVALATALSATVTAGREVQAETRCRPIHARITTQFTTENCTSPVGLCTAGHIEGGPFDGATTFETLAAAPSAGMPTAEPAANLSYSGIFTMTSRKGNFVASDLGVLDVSRAVFTEMSRAESGTGRFSNASGVLYINGVLLNDATEFQGTVTGDLCTDRDHDDD